mgnify:CR=1 FL=1
MLGNHTDAEEALSIAMMKLIRCWAEKEPELRNPMAWVSIVVKNVCNDIQRQNSRRMAREVVEQEDSKVYFLEELSFEGEKMPFDDLESRELYEILLDYLYQLPESIMITAILRFRDDLEYKDIASTLSIQENTARKRVEYARKRLMKEDTLRAIMNL